MKDSPDSEASESAVPVTDGSETDGSETDRSVTEAEADTTGLPWPKTWNGAYLLVMASFILWVALLIALTEYA
jgi:hypothetical protein